MALERIPADIRAAGGVSRLVPDINGDQIYQRRLNVKETFSHG